MTESIDNTNHHIFEIRQLYKKLINDYEVLQKEHSKLLADREEVNINLRKISQKV